MAAKTNELWRTTSVALEEQLLARGYSLNMGISDLESFQASMEKICTTYARKNVSSIIRDKMQPHLDHLHSFEKAVGTSSQLSKASALVWSGTLIVIECASRFSKHLDQVFDLLGKFYSSIPRFDRYLHLFPDNQRLRARLNRLFVDYGDLCVHILQWTKRHPMTHMAAGLFSSGPSNKLKSIISSMEGHSTDFKEEAEIAFVEHQMSLNSPSFHPEINANEKKSSPYLVMERRDPRFCGRAGTLETIHTHLAQAKTSSMAEANSCLVYGLSGIGKTATALEYTYAYRSSYDSIFWMGAEKMSDLVQSYTRVVAKLRSLDLIREQAPKDTEDVGGRNDAKDWFENTDQKWLLVLDNVEDWQTILQYWPTSAKAQSAILVTTQKGEFRRDTSWSVELEDLSVEDASKLLLTGSGQAAQSSEVEAARKITDVYGGLPLAMTHIAAYCGDLKMPLQEFLKLISKRYPAIWDGDVGFHSSSSTKRLNILWDFALDELATHEEAQMLLYTMAFLNPDSMSESMFFSKIDLRDGEYTAEKANFLGKIQLLVKRALVRPITEIQGSYAIHRALQKFLLFKLDRTPELRSRIFDRAFQSVHRITPHASPIQVPVPSLWSRFEKAVPQVIALQAAFEQSHPAISGSVMFSQLLYDAAFNTWERESSQDGLRLLETAEDVLDEVSYDKNGKLRADILVMRGVICDNIGISKRETALTVRKEITRIRTIIFDNRSDMHDNTDDILLHNALNDTAESYLQYYDYEQADRLIETCRKSYARWGTETEYPFEYGKYYRNKGAVLTLQGDFSSAIRSARRSVELAELDTGVGPRYLLYLQDVASYMLQSGDVVGALKQHKEVFELREQHCGKYHDVTLQSSYAVGAMYYQLKDWGKAEYWFKETLDRAKGARWPEEPLCRAQYHYAQTLRQNKKNGPEQAERLETARELEKISLDVLNRLLKYHLPDQLKDVGDDKLVLFDHLQPAFRGRWTGRALLKYIRGV